MTETPHRTDPAARDMAFAALTAWERTGEFVTQSLAAEVQHASPQERRLAQELAYGVVRRLSTLDALLEPHVTRPRHKVEEDLWTLLQMGAYQIVLLEGIPPHAAVHETVEVARRSGHPQWVGFANAVLRRVAEMVTAEKSDVPGPGAVPLSDGRYRVLSRPVFADLAVRKADYLAAAFGLPRWLIDRWSSRLSADEMARLGFWFNASPSVWLRVNLLRTTREAFLEALAAAGIHAEAGTHPAAVRLRSAASIEALPGFAQGWFSVQDESAMQAGSLLAPQPGEVVLDLCAAPGTKTTHLAELMQNRGRIVAADVEAARLARIGENVERLGAGIVETVLIRDDGCDVPEGPFDVILVDVPCSNTGVLGRRPEARWRLEPKDIAELATIQRRLLNVACGRLKPGGRLVYSTCSIEPEENGQLVRSVLRHRRDVVLQAEYEHVPGRPADGGYQALMTKLSDAP